MPDDFPEQLAELLAYLEDRLPPQHPFARLSAVLPGRPERPEAWLLGSSPQSAIWAGEMGLPYSFADFINPEGAGIAALYRQKFVDSERLAAPRTAVCVWTICAETDDEAVQLASSSRMAMSMMRQGRLIAVPPVDKALRYLESRGGPSGAPRRRAVLGSAATVKAGVEQVAAEYEADEVMLVTITFDHALRMRSYEMVAEAFGLDAAPAPASALA